MAEDLIKDYARTTDFSVMILRLVRCTIWFWKKILIFFIVYFHRLEITTPGWLPVIVHEDLSKKGTPQGFDFKIFATLKLKFGNQMGVFCPCRYFNVIGSDPKGRLGEAPRPELRKHARISGACFDAATGVIPGLEVKLRVCCSWWRFDHARNLVLTTLLHYLSCQEKRDGKKCQGYEACSWCFLPIYWKIFFSIKLRWWLCVCGRCVGLITTQVMAHVYVTTSMSVTLWMHMWRPCSALHLSK